MAKKTIESKYQKLTDTEHVLLRPSMYIGSVAIHSGDQYLYDGEKVTIEGVILIKEGKSELMIKDQLFSLLGKGSTE